MNTSAWGILANSACRRRTSSCCDSLRSSQGRSRANTTPLLVLGGPKKPVPIDSKKPSTSGIPLSVSSMRLSALERVRRGRALRRAQRDADLAAILDRQEVAGQAREQRQIGEHDRDQRQAHPAAMPQAPGESRSVALARPEQRALDAARYASRVRSEPQVARAQHGHQRQCHEQRDRDRYGERQRELPEQVACLARYQGQRDRHRDRARPGREHCEADLAAPLSAARRGGSPSSWRRCTFSSTTIASSTSRPTESTSASSVNRLIENPIAHIAPQVPSSETGIATA